MQDAGARWTQRSCTVYLHTRGGEGDVLAGGVKFYRPSREDFC